MKKTVMGTVLVLALGLTVGCSDDEDDPSFIDEVTDPNCADICDAFDACVRDIDIGRCVDQCDNATEVDAVADQAERCEDCLDDKSCTDARGCWADCIQVPEMTIAGPVPPNGPGY
jgi:hypothetical protein